MKRFNVLIFLTIIGLLGVYQFFPFFETYSIGLINSLLFFVLCILYFVILIYEIYLNNQDVIYDKKEFDKSSLWITLILLFTLILFKNIDLFDSKTIIKAEGKYNYTLDLKANGKFKLIQRTNYESHIYKGKYTIQEDTLLLYNNNVISTRSLIDTIFIRRNDSLIPKSHINKFAIIN